MAICVDPLDHSTMMTEYVIYYSISMKILDHGRRT